MTKNPLYTPSKYLNELELTACREATFFHPERVVDVIQGGYKPGPGHAVYLVRVESDNRYAGSIYNDIIAHFGFANESDFRMSMTGGKDPFAKWRLVS